MLKLIHENKHECHVSIKFSTFPFIVLRLFISTKRLNLPETLRESVLGSSSFGVFDYLTCEYVDSFSQYSDILGTKRLIGGLKKENNRMQTNTAIMIIH